MNRILLLFVAHALRDLLEILVSRAAIGSCIGRRILVLVVCLVGRHLEVIEEASVKMST